jgi:hypothetical protein
MNKVVIAVDKSRNSKTGLVSATYAPIQSCPSNCPFLNNGCYAQTSYTGMKLVGLNKEASKIRKVSSNKIARIEAESIRKLKGKLPLRLHVVGDCKTPMAARILSCAAEDYINKNNQPVWTYTHAWREIPRENWGDISVLASCETLEECKQAMKRGYAASVVRLKPFKGTMPFSGLKMTACKELTKGIKCNDCKLCFNDQRLLEDNKVICFFPHGIRSEKARDAILRKA